MALPILFYAAAALISAGTSYVATQKAKKAQKGARGSTLNKNSNIEPLPVLYGERRIGGTRVYLSSRNVSGGDKNEYLYIALALCEGEVQSIDDIEIDGNPITGMNTPGDRFYNLLTIEKYLGTDTQTASPILKESSTAWTNDHRLQGVAYIAIRLKYYYKSFSGVPEITAVVKGRKVYDPRTSTTGYSTNPALCIRDYLTSTRYGKGLASGFIDETAFIQAADDCDDSVVFYTGAPSDKIFECNTLIDTEEEIFANLQSMLQGCRGFLPYSQGKYGLVIDKSSEPVFGFTTDTIVGGIQIKGESKADKYNRVICRFINPAANWQEDTAVYPPAGSAEEEAFLAEDGGTLLQGEFILDTITNYYAARDFARIFLRRSRNAMRVSFNASSEALQLSVADVVTVTHPTPGFAAKPFQVEEITLNYDGTCGVSLLEYDSTIYTYDLSAVQTVYPDTVLPDPFTVAAPTDLAVTETTYLSSDGTVVPEIAITWTPSADSFVIEYELQYKLSDDAEYFSIITREPRVSDYGAVIGSTYDVRVRAINSIGSDSDFISTTYTVAGDTSAPATPTGLTITGSYNEATLKWNAASEKDYKETWIYASTTNNSASATLEAKISGNTVTVINLPKNTTYYVWLKNVDFTGNVSAFSTVVSFNTTDGLTSTALADNAVTTAKINGLAVTAIKIGPSAVTTDKINANAVTNAKLDANAIAANVFAAGVQPLGIFATVPLTKTTDTIFVTSTAKLYRWNGTAYVKTVESDDIVGLVANKITAGTINAAITTTSILQLSTNGRIYTAGKDSAASANAGIFLGWDTAGTPAHKLSIGNATKSLKWDGSALTFSGDMITAGQVMSTGTTTSGGYNASMVAQPTTSTTAGVVAITGSGGALFGISASGDGVTATTSSTSSSIAAANLSAGGGSRTIRAIGGDVEINKPSFLGIAPNLLIGGATSVGNRHIAISQTTSAGVRTTGQMQLYAANSGAGNTTLGLTVWQSAEGSGLFTQSHKLRIVINGAEYYIPLEAI